MRIYGNLIISWLVLLTSVSYAGWTPPVRISDEGASYAPRIAANGDTLHAVYWTWSGTARSYYIRSLVGGNLWEAPFRLGDSLIVGSENSPLIRFVGDTIVAVWHQNLPGGGQYNLGFRCSTNGGETWGEVTYILPSNSYELQNHTFYIVEGTIFLIYSRWAQNILIEFTKSTDLGETWMEPTEVFRTQETGRFDMAAIGEAIHLVWPGLFEYGNSWETYYIKSNNGGGQWSDNLLLTTPDSIGSQDCCIAMKENRHMAVIWMDGKYSPNWWNGDLFVRYSYDAGEAWTEEEQITFTHWAGVPRAVWIGDSIHVAWEDWRHGQPDIFYMISENNGSSWGEEERIDDSPGMSLKPDLVVVDETVHVVWRQDSGLDGRGIYYSRWDEEVGIDNDADIPLPEELSLAAYPNPFNSSTVITYRGLERGEIEIYNIRGQKIRTLTTKAKEGKITHTGQVIWDARDALGNKVSSGIYFARVRNGSVGTRAPRSFNTIKIVYLR